MNTYKTYYLRKKMHLNDFLLQSFPKLDTPEKKISITKVYCICHFLSKCFLNVMVLSPVHIGLKCLIR